MALDIFSSSFEDDMSAGGGAASAPPTSAPGTATTTAAVRLYTMENGQEIVHDQKTHSLAHPMSIFEST